LWQLALANGIRKRLTGLTSIISFGKWHSRWMIEFRYCD
jgi:hypothetical protein